MQNSNRLHEAVVKAAALAFERLIRPHLVEDLPETVFWVWPREDRVILAIDPLAVKSIDTLLNARFTHHLSTALQGRRVIKTNTRGVFFQVDYEQQLQAELTAVVLDLSSQPSPVAVPIGMTKRGPLWLDLTVMDSVLIGGARRMGKSRFVHAWIQALEHGGRARLFLWDGKDGQEFGRYQGRMGVLVDNDLEALLLIVMAEAERRRELFKQSGVTSLPEYNAQAAQKLDVLVPVIDEAAFIPEGCQGLLHDLVARCGAYGVHPVIATQRPDAGAVQTIIKANLSTRISFAVPSSYDSQVILGRSGAQDLPKRPGRLLISHAARTIQAQAFLVEVPAGATAQGNGLKERELAVLECAAQRGGKVTMADAQRLGLSEWDARQTLAGLAGVGLLEKSIEKGPRTLTKAGWAAVSQSNQSAQYASKELFGAQ